MHKRDGLICLAARAALRGGQLAAAGDERAATLRLRKLHERVPLTMSAASMPRRSGRSGKCKLAWAIAIWLSSAFNDVAFGGVRAQGSGGT